MRIATDNEKQAFAIKMIKTSSQLIQMYREYQNEGEETFKKIWLKAQEAGKTNYSESHVKNESIIYANKNRIIVNNFSQNASFIIHLCVKEASFNNLTVIEPSFCY